MLRKLGISTHCQPLDFAKRGLHISSKLWRCCYLLWLVLLAAFRLWRKGCPSCQLDKCQRSAADLMRKAAARMSGEINSSILFAERALTLLMSCGQRGTRSAFWVSFDDFKKPEFPRPSSHLQTLDSSRIPSRLKLAIFLKSIHSLSPQLLTVIARRLPSSSKLPDQPTS